MAHILRRTPALLAGIKKGGAAVFVFDPSISSEVAVDPARAEELQPPAEPVEGPLSPDLLEKMSEPRVPVRRTSQGALNRAG